jgi:peptidoglycan/xylan/chitin deacetylase (PgdA/CDA1 family)
MTGPMALAIRSLAARLGRGGVIINEHVISAEQIRLHVETLAKVFDFVHHDDLLERIENPGRRPFCLLTFDDGKRSNATEVAPELGRLGVPGVFYLVAGFLDTGKPLWFDRRDALRRALGELPAELGSDVLKKLPHRLVRERLDRAAETHGVDADPSDPDVGPMSWDEARALAEAGFTLGAHTIDHPVLTCESRAEAQRQIARSVERLEEETGAPCSTFAFTNGNYTADLGRFVLSRGVATAVTTEPLWVEQGFPAWRLPRIQLFPGQSPARILLKVGLGLRPGALADPSGTGRVYREIRALERAGAPGISG